MLDLLFNFVRYLNIAKWFSRRQDPAAWMRKALADAAAMSEALGVTEEADAIVVGSGLAGLSAALTLLDRGATVVIVEKEHVMGGNTKKASSGMNACIMGDEGDAKLFKDDTMKSAGELAREQLIDLLVDGSPGAKHWLETRVGVDLSQHIQLGGHSVQRTHRPLNGMIGAEVVSQLTNAVRLFERRGAVKILLDTKVTRLVRRHPDGAIVGVEVVTRGTTEQAPACVTSLVGRTVVLASGGFAADRSGGSLLEHHRPELLQMATTAGPFSTGDGVKLAMGVGAATVDMDKVQLHPTGWIDPNDPHSKSKILAAELTRGAGGLLLNDAGKRFCNELGTRAYVTDKMLSSDSEYAANGKWNAAKPIPTFALVLSSASAAVAKKHMDFYVGRGLVKKVEGVTGLSEWLGCDASVVRATLKQYSADSAKGLDEFGKTAFRGVPGAVVGPGDDEDSALDKETFFAGRVTPVLHYCMGGVTIDGECRVLDASGAPIAGLHAAGEVTGGVHGANRLGGNSLLECAVFGRIVGNKLPVRKHNFPDVTTEEKGEKEDDVFLRPITREELARHNTEKDCKGDPSP